MAYFRHQRKAPVRMFSRRYGLRSRKLNKTQVKQVKRIISKKSEPKHFDASLAATQVDRAGVGPTVMSNIPQGSAQGQRAGDELQTSVLEFNFDAYFTNGATLAGHAIRCIIFRWNVDTSLAAPSLGSIIQGIGSINEINSPYDWNAKRQGDFTILYDKVFGLFQGNSVVRRLRIPLKGAKVVYDPASTNSAEGHLYALFLGDDVTGVHTPNVNVQWQSRLVYHDG